MRPRAKLHSTNPAAGVWCGNVSNNALDGLLDPQRCCCPGGSWQDEAGERTSSRGKRGTTLHGRDDSSTLVSDGRNQG